MKKTLQLTLLISLCSVLGCAPKKINYLEQFNSMYFNDSIAQAKQLLDEWSATGLSDGDYYSCQFNYYLNQGLHTGVTMSVALPLFAIGEQVLELNDTITGRPSSYMYNGHIIVDSLLIDTAFNWLDRGIEHCPNRLDLYLGKATAYLYCLNPNAMIEMLERAMQQEQKNKGKWLWTNNEKLDKSVGMLYNRVQEDFARFLEGEYFDEALLLAQTAIKYYPKRAEYANNMAVVYFYQEDYNQALSWFHKALELNPNDELIKHNIEYLEEILKQEQTNNRD